MDKVEPNFISNLEYVARTHVGMRRANNQDAHTVVLAEDEQSWRQRGHVFMVADGMGAHAAGELASKLAVDNVPHLYHHYREISPPEALERAILEANHEIHRRGQENPDFYKMGTTASILVLLPGGALVGHVGDSRVYRLRQDHLEQLTFDHSLVWELRASGQAGADEVAKRVPSNVITRSLGPNAKVVADLEGMFPLEVGDAFLLCSDGLSGQVEDHEIGTLLATLPLEEAVQVLIDLANLRGGPDNSTVIIVRVTGVGAEGEGAASSTIHTGQGRQASTVDLAAWVVMGVCWLLALLLWSASQSVPAVLSAVGGVIAMLVGIVAKFRGAKSTASDTGPQHKLGAGPHTRVACRADRPFVNALSAIVVDLQEAAVDGDWQVDWHQFNQLQRSAVAAAKTGNFPEAVRCHARTVSFLMDQARHQQKAPTDDSILDS